MTQAHQRPDVPDGPQPAEDARNRAYYDEFSARYDDERGGRRPGGYHDLVDELEVGFVEEIVRSQPNNQTPRLLEVGCGTGLLLERFATFTAATGIDVSPGMLARARARGLDAIVGSATDLPFPDDHFDVVCSFKVLAHVDDIQSAMREMFRVVRPGGLVIAEFYNPYSLRALVKRVVGARPIGPTQDESAITTRFDPPHHLVRLLPGRPKLLRSRGIRIVTPTASAMDLPTIGPALGWLERRACDSLLRHAGGFYVCCWQKDVCQ